MSNVYFAQTAVEFLSQQGSRNPFDGITPDFNVFGIQFTKAWQKVLAGLWGLTFVWLAGGALRAAYQLQEAKKGGYSAGVLEHTDGIKRLGMALAVVSGIGIIFGAVVALF